jgi:hypothetical protein
MANERRVTFNPALTEAEFAEFCVANPGLRIARFPSSVIIARRKRKDRDDHSNWLLSHISLRRLESRRAGLQLWRARS